VEERGASEAERPAGGAVVSAEVGGRGGGGGGAIGSKERRGWIAQLQKRVTDFP
jgi:hypothetical protein